MSVDISSTNGNHIREVRIAPYPVKTEFGVVRAMRVFPSADRYFRREAHPTPIVVSQGWGETMQHTLPFAEHLARTGFTTTLFDYPSSISRIIPVDEVQDYRESVFNSVLDEEGFIADELAVFAHSEGAYAALRACAKRNDISAALLAAPAGLIGKLTFRELVGCGIDEGREALRGRRQNQLGGIALAKAFYGLARNVVGSPQLSVAEILSIARTDALPDFDIAHERGVKLGIVACSGDRIFPAERMITHLDGREKKIPRFTVLDTNHFNFLLREETSQKLIDETESLLLGEAA